MTAFKCSIFTGNLIFWFAIPAILFVATICIKINPDKEEKIWKRFSRKTIVYLCCIFLIECCVVALQVDAYQKIVVPYHQGEYQMVRGEVQDYIPAATSFNPHESFQVNGIFFSYGGGECKNYFGYDKTGLEGGVITSNGIYVEIAYITYREKNIIVQLDVFE